MKKIYLKPTTEAYALLESGGIMDGISGNGINGVTDEKNRDQQLEEGGTGDGTGMGAKRFDFDWDLEDFNEVKDTWE